MALLEFTSTTEPVRRTKFFSDVELSVPLMVIVLVPSPYQYVLLAEGRVRLPLKTTSPELIRTYGLTDKSNPQLKICVDPLSLTSPFPPFVVTWMLSPEALSSKVKALPPVENVMVFQL
ncbi:MAG: hypothetical protein JXB10_11675 [Pirellulales bacterium]|nr:hypothetical protein [Pirellulales bacterium]